MIDKSVERRMAELKKTVNSATKELDDISQALKLFPDLKIKTDRWSNKRLSSKSANEKVNDFFQAASCGCCADSPIFVYPYVQLGDIKVFSEPERFFIGEKSDFVVSGEIYDPTSVEQLKESGISYQVINRVAAIVHTKPEYIDEDDEEEID